MEAMRPLKSDRRILRSQRALREALVAELNSGVDIARVSVAALTGRAGLTRRTFYSHYKDIPDFIEQVEDALLAEVRVLVRAIADTLHGDCGAENVPGGIAFWFDIPDEMSRN